MAADEVYRDLWLRFHKTTLKTSRSMQDYQFKLLKANRDLGKLGDAYKQSGFTLNMHFLEHLGPAYRPHVDHLFHHCLRVPDMRFSVLVDLAVRWEKEMQVDEASGRAAGWPTGRRRGSRKRGDMGSGRRRAFDVDGDIGDAIRG